MKSSGRLLRASGKRCIKQLERRVFDLRSGIASLPRGLLAYASCLHVYLGCPLTSLIPECTLPSLIPNIRSHFDTTGNPGYAMHIP